MEYIFRKTSSCHGSAPPAIALVFMFRVPLLMSHLCSPVSCHHSVHTPQSALMPFTCHLPLLNPKLSLSLCQIIELLRISKCQCPCHSFVCLPSLDLMPSLRFPALPAPGQFWIILSAYGINIWFLYFDHASRITFWIWLWTSDHLCMTLAWFSGPPAWISLKSTHCSVLPHSCSKFTTGDIISSNSLKGSLPHLSVKVSYCLNIRQITVREVCSLTLLSLQICQALGLWRPPAAAYE